MLWVNSAGSVHRLITTVMRLPAHDVSMTLKLNRTISFLEGMAKPLARFTTNTKTTEKNLEEAERQLARVITHGGNLAEKAKIKVTITVPVRYNLKEKRTVCCHPSCTSQVKDEDGALRTVFKTICHDGCDIEVADEIKGANGLQSCRPFRRWLRILTGYNCNREGCEHDWEEHMHISYELRDEVRAVDDESVLDEIRSNEGEMQVLEHKIKTTKNSQQMIRKEREQIQQARALFYVYLCHNAVGTSRAYSDATIQYLDLHIAMANRDGRTDEQTELMLQKSAHLDEVETLQEAIAVGTVAIPDERVVERTIKGLKNMDLFGKELSNAVNLRNVEFEGPRFIFVESKPKTKKGSWFRWSG
ncbi:hypothetical protein CC80DRAFT_562620 [Byssothecium circinans]|uniref:DUF8206 domain-containing protein n=1 Tax=Byssothecium circinans TaxID=147558 RepID=A0A6A5TW28_9PLEO|nr:hypothetical protein CC80DRAFT_562620 [Byssothecium circinans]